MSHSSRSTAHSSIGQDPLFKQGEQVYPTVLRALAFTLGVRVARLSLALAGAATIMQAGKLRLIDSLDRVTERVFDAPPPGCSTLKISAVLPRRANVLRGVPKTRI